MRIRALIAGDRAAWEPLWQAYLAFYRHPLPAEVTAVTFDRLAAGRDGLAGLLALDDSGSACGLAHTVTHAATWASEPSVYLEDLYVAPSARGTGAGRALLDAVTARARAAGAGTLYWMTQEYNAPARSLYDTVGQRTSFVVYTRDLA